MSYFWGCTHKNSRIYNAPYISDEIPGVDAGSISDALDHNDVVVIGNDGIAYTLKATGGDQFDGCSCCEVSYHLVGPDVVPGLEDAGS